MTIKLGLHVAILCVLLVAASVSGSRPTPQEAAAMGVVQRLLPQHFAKFRLVQSEALKALPRKPLVVKHSHYDTFSVNASSGFVEVHGTSGVALCAGVYWYLKNVTKCQVTWGEQGTGNQLSLPTVLPDVALTVRTTSVAWRYAWNMCTLSYSAAWWDWARWEKELDWMALHGVNMPLAFTGQEYIWVKVWEKLGATLGELQEWFTGPAFLAWQRAGNIRGFAGPLSRSWIEAQRDLQLLTLKRMRSLGMTPVLPCFAGHVPEVARRIFPHANITQSVSWNLFPTNETFVWYVVPTDDLYLTLGKLYMDTMIATFGTDSFYNCDTFNEVNPTSAEPEYLKAASAAVYKGIVASDAKGVWVMQGWLFHDHFWDKTRVKDYLSGVPNDSMMILDLNSEEGALAHSFDQYFGKQWIWNLLHNYGGVRGVYGNLSRVATSPFADLHERGSTMTGIGFTPEAIEQNPVIYELLTDTFWTNSSIDLEEWRDSYVIQRYGVASPSALKAWRSLTSAVYNVEGRGPHSDLEHFPRYIWIDFGWNKGETKGATRALLEMLDAASELPTARANGPFQYDLVDVARQAAIMLFSDVHRMLMSTANHFNEDMSNNTASIQRTAVFIQRMIGLLDDLLGTNPNYLLGTWLNSSVAWASATGDNKWNYLYNAKNQITLWGPTAQINDYAAKAWSGLYSSYYAARWKLFTDALIDQAVRNATWKDLPYQINAAALQKAWVEAHSLFPTTTNGKDAIGLARQLYQMIADEEPLKQYHAIPNTDLLFGDTPLSPMWTRDLRQLAILCSLDDKCIGFNSAGMIKVQFTGFINVSGTSLYLRTHEKA